MLYWEWNSSHNIRQAGKLNKNSDHLRIAICDDQAEEREEILSLAEEFSLAKGRPFIFEVVENGFALLDFIEKGQAYDLIILDIIMPGMTGIETAREIRKYDTDVKVVFLTSSAEFAVDSYAVGAYYYLLKPVNRSILFDILEKAFRSIDEQSEASIIVNDGGTAKRLLLSELVYCEITQRIVSFYLYDGTIIRSQGTLSGLEQDILKYSYFAKPHRSYLVNLRHVSEVKVNEILTDTGNKIPLARGRHGEICHAFISQAFEDVN